jgi:hypothetical protein
MPVELLAPAHDCVLPGGDLVATCVPVALSAQAMYGTSVPMKATAVSGNSTINIDTATAEFVMRIREPADGPPTGYLIDDGGVPTLVVALDLYLDAPDLLTGLLTNDMHSKPLHVILRGPMRFLPDGRIAIATTNTEDLPVTVGLSGGVTGSIKLLIPRGAMTLQLVSPLLRGGQP